VALTPLEWLAAGSFIVGPLGVMLAGVVYAVAPRRRVNRILATILFLEGASFFLGGGIESLLIQGGQGVAMLTAVHAAFVAAWLLILPLYLMFLAETLDVPVLRPLRNWPAQAALLTVAGGAFLYARSMPGGLWTSEGTHGAAFDAVMLAAGGVAFFALIVALWAWRRTPYGSAARRRARLFVVAFGIRDANYLLFSLLLPRWGLDAFKQEATPLVGLFFLLGLFTSLCVIAYAVLKHQLFDIDLRIKWGLSRGAVLASFVAVFFIVAQVAQAFLTTAFGWALGGLAAGVLLLGLSPMQRLAARLADTAMPGVRDTETYRGERKAAVYEAALEELLADGALTAKERRTLLRLQRELQLDAAMAVRVEERVLDRLEAT
jgi:hypothetical protein